tara:strand:+ start:64 stop:693 length:630 start_codon:yes stop_codon:yes gene_type:complete
MTVRYVLTDLCEVLKRGMIGMEDEVAPVLGVEPVEFIDGAVLIPQLWILFRGEITEQQYWNAVVKEAGYSKTLDGHGKTTDLFAAAVRRNFVLMDGTHEVYDRVRAAGVTLWSLSDHAVEWVADCEGPLRLRERFDGQVYSYDLGKTKHDPSAFADTIARMGVNPAETIYIDDNPAHIMRARDSGIGYGHHFTTAENLELELRRLGVLD